MKRSSAPPEQIDSSGAAFRAAAAARESAELQVFRTLCDPALPTDASTLSDMWTERRREKFCLRVLLDEAAAANQRAQEACRAASERPRPIDAADG